MESVPPSSWWPRQHPSGNLSGLFPPSPESSMTDLAPAPLSSRRWWVCLLLMFATTINYMDRVALNQLALRIKTYFALSNTQYSLLESAFSIAFAIGAFATGIIVDRSVCAGCIRSWCSAGRSRAS